MEARFLFWPVCRYPRGWIGEKGHIPGQNMLSISIFFV